MNRDDCDRDRKIDRIILVALLSIPVILYVAAAIYFREGV
jgi:hypothetical protein